MEGKRVVLVVISALAGLGTGAVVTRSKDGPSVRSSDAPIAPELQPIKENRTPTSELAAGPRAQLEYFDSLLTLDSDGCVDLFEDYAKKSTLLGIKSQRNFQALIERWVEIDPKRAVKAMLALPLGTQIGERLIDFAVRGWAKAAAADPEVLTASLQQIQAVSNRDLKVMFVKGLFGGIDAPTFKEAMERGGQVLDSFPHSLCQETGILTQDHIFEAMLAQWIHLEGAMDPSRHPTGNPLELYEFATDEIDDPALRWQGQITALRELARLDPKSAAEALGTLTLPESESKRIALLGTIASEWLNLDTERAVEWIFSLPEDDQRKLVNSPGSWVEPKRMAELAILIPAEKRPPGFASSIASSWLRHDPEAAMAWFRAQPESKNPKNVDALFDSFGFLTVPAIVELSKLEHVSAEKFQRAISGVMQAGASADEHADLLALRDTLTNKEMIRAIHSAILADIAWKEPLAAREELDSVELTEAQRKSLLTRLGAQLRWHESVSDTLGWLEELNSADAGVVARQALPAFLRDSPEEALPVVTEWLNGLPAEQQGERNIETITKSAVTAMFDSVGDPAAVAHWAVTGLADGLRETAVGEIIKSWAAVDPRCRLGLAQQAPTWHGERRSDHEPH